MNKIYHADDQGELQLQIHNADDGAPLQGFVISGAKPNAKFFIRVIKGSQGAYTHLKGKDDGGE